MSKRSIFVMLSIVAAFFFTAAGFVILLWVNRQILAAQWGRADRENEEDVRGKVVLITGANAGIGKETAQEMAHRGATVIMASRNMEKSESAIKDIRRHTCNGELISMKLDLASIPSIHKFATDFKGKFDKLHILINNAGVFEDPRRKLRTRDGFEIHLGVNHLGHFLLTLLLLEHIKKAAPSRIIILSSMLHVKGNLDLEDLMLERTTEEFHIILNNKPYFNSKLANALFAQELAYRCCNSGVHVYCLCPGVVQTDLVQLGSAGKFFYTLLLFLFFKTPKQGCQTTLYCALSKSVSQHTGRMYQHCGEWLERDRIPLDRTLASLLWSRSEKLVGLCTAGNSSALKAERL